MDRIWEAHREIQRVIIGDQLFKRGVGLAGGARTDERAEPPRGVAGPRAAPHLNRPDVLNALSAELVERLSEALTRAARDDDARVVIIRGAGRAFCAGYDLKEEAEREAREAPWTWPRAAGAPARRGSDARALRPPQAGDRRGPRLLPGRRLRPHDDVRPRRGLGRRDVRGAGDPLRLRRDHGHAVSGPEGPRSSCSPARTASLPRKASAKPGQQGGPRDELEEETLRLARAIAVLDPVAISLTKRAINRTWSSRGSERSAPTWTSTP